MTNSKATGNTHNSTDTDTARTGHAPLAPVIAHRGASGEAPENTLAALSLAADMGARCVEIDVSISQDNVGFVHHDHQLQRCTSGQGLLTEHSAAQLDLLDASTAHADYHGEVLPRLTAAIDLLKARGMGLNLEIKPYKGLEQRTVNVICDTIEEHWPSHLPLVFSSFSHVSLGLALQRLPHIPRALLLGPISDDWSELMHRYECRNVHCSAGELTQEQSTAVLEQGFGSILACTAYSQTIRGAFYNRTILELLSRHILWGILFKSLQNI